MKFKSSIIVQIAISGLLVGIAVAFAFFTFPIGIYGRVYIVGIPLFLLPLFVRWQFSIISTLIGVVLADFFTGFITWTWISLIAYGLAAGILLISRLKFVHWVYLILVIVALAEISVVYFVLEWTVFNYLEWAIADLIATSIQGAIVAAGIFVLYWPALLIKRSLNLVT